MAFLKSLFGTYSSRELKRINPIVEKVLSYEEEFKSYTDAQLRAKTEEFKERYKNGETLDMLLPEAFANVREASWRVLQMKHFPVQIIGGIVLHQGRIAEMKTGEGKTLVATLPAYLNALTGEGVHIVTVNDYLAKRDSEWMGKLYSFLGLTTGLVINQMTPDERKIAYNSDITYGTNNELGFDYLRDNMAIYKDAMVQRGHVYAIVDEVDSILIDEARTPLIISGIGDKSTDLYKTANSFAITLKKKVVKEEDTKVLDETDDADYIIDEKAKTVTLTPRGVEKAESYFGLENLSDPENMTVSHHINQALRANGIMMKDKDYIVSDENEILIVDEFTGRVMPGRRYSDGLHQAIEAKEGVVVQHESKTLATITFQNFFRMYKKISGMTGTALTEEREFQDIYSMDVIEIPTNKPLARKDLPDSVYKSEEGKFKAIVEKIKECYEKQQPVLVGTITIEKSEKLSSMLKRNGIPHNVLNAKHHAREAEIIAQAGKKGAVTIATNMAGRGTDIMLGGNPEYLAKNELKKLGFDENQINEAVGYGDTDDEAILSARETYREVFAKFKAETEPLHEEVAALGGLYIIGTERHESRRIDNQLRGRAGRQGDPGVSKFYVALEDEIIRLFGAERTLSVMNAIQSEEELELESKMLSNLIETAQKKIEGRNFDIRKHVLQYDDVMNAQRELIYRQRQQVLDGNDITGNIRNMIETMVEDMVSRYTSSGEYPDDWQLDSLIKAAEAVFLPEGSVSFSREDLESLERNDITEILTEKAFEAYKAKEEEIGTDIMRELERIIMLRVVDTRWMDHIDEMDRLKQGIGLRSYGQHDPAVEYKNVGSDMFDEMVYNIKTDVGRFVFTAKVDRMERKQVAQSTSEGRESDKQEKPKTVRKAVKVGRNDMCPCGSGLKYKKCCGK
ncbi:MAG: preprotein translocase subunit SecA [Clostridia bacterium]|nr:preprotein translocase subunit SecA [Clostridia bacterium]